MAMQETGRAPDDLVRLLPELGQAGPGILQPIADYAFKALDQVNYYVDLLRNLEGIDLERAFPALVIFRLHDVQNPLTGAGLILDVTFGSLSPEKLAVVTTGIGKTWAACRLIVGGHGRILPEPCEEYIRKTFAGHLEFVQKAVSGDIRDRSILVQGVAIFSDAFLTIPDLNLGISREDMNYTADIFIQNFVTPG